MINLAAILYIPFFGLLFSIYSSVMSIKFRRDPILFQASLWAALICWATMILTLLLVIFR